MDTRSFAEKFLFDPLQIRNIDWLKFRDGYYDGCGLLSIRLREPDMIKIGMLVLHHGKYEKKQIVPEKWIYEIFNPTVSYPTPWGFDHSLYSLCWYHATYQQTQLIYGLGWGGQFLLIIPRLNAVVAISENTANFTAIAQSEVFIHKIFPVIFKVLQK
jgi:CubicO group peptidase (beta-lactamase class C family)